MRKDNCSRSYTRGLLALYGEKRFISSTENVSSLMKSRVFHFLTKKIVSTTKVIFMFLKKLDINNQYFAPSSGNLQINQFVHDSNAIL